MLPAAQRLSSSEVADVFKHGTWIRGTEASLRVSPNTSNEPPRFGVVVGKKIAHGAVSRNRLRRAGYRCRADVLDRVEPGTRGVLVIQSSEPKDLCAVIFSLLGEAGVMLNG